MVNVPKYKRLYALALVAATDVGFALLPIQGFDAGNVALLFSMLLAVVVAFLFSAFSHLIKFEQMLYKYVISGAVGIAFGAASYFVLKGLDLLSMEWVNIEGKFLFIVLNIAAAIYLFFSKRD